MALNHADLLAPYVVRTARTPQGPTGLWDALVAATAPDTIACTDVADTVELSSVAHLAYLARLQGGSSVPTAEVIDLEVYRSRRSA